MEMDTKIGIIGITGKFGSHLQHLFTELGYEVIGSALGTELTNIEVVERSDVVIFAVPIRYSVDVMTDCLEAAREDQLWLDITGLKRNQMTTMFYSGASVIGLHPMFAPPKILSWEGQNVILCRSTQCEEHWFEWLMEVLNHTKAQVIETNFIVHDKLMSFIQVLTHASALVAASTITELRGPFGMTLDFASPVYKLFLMPIGRILAQNPDLYADMQMENHYTMGVLKAMRKCLDNFIQIIETKDHARFREEVFERSIEDFGKEPIKQLNQLCEEMIGFMTKSS